MIVNYLAYDISFGYVPRAWYYDDYNIYVATQNEDGDWVSTEESIGLTVSLYSFVHDDDKTPMIGSIINPDDASGSAFIKEMTEHLRPLMSYMPRALNNKIFDFKATGGVRKGHFNKSEYYRGILFISLWYIMV